MGPITMLLGYGLANSLSQLVVRPIADKMTAKSRQKDMFEQMECKRELDLEVCRLNKELEQENLKISKQLDLQNQAQLQSYAHQLRMQEAQAQFEKQLELWQLGKFDSSVWPLKTPFDHPSLKNQVRGGIVPINIFMAQADPKSPFAQMLQSDVKNKLSNFLQTEYSKSSDHLSVCRVGDWKDGVQDAAFINALWYGMQGQPTIILNPIQSEFGELLELNVSLWGLAADTTPSTQTVLKCKFASAIGKIKRDETAKWVEFGIPLSKELEENAKLLEQEKMLKEKNVPQEYIDRLLNQYKLTKEIQHDVINTFTQEFSFFTDCVAGMSADIYHLIEYGTAPYMPTAVKKYSEQNNLDYQIPDVVIDYYRKALLDLACNNYFQDRLSYIYLDVAQSLDYNKEQALDIIKDSVGIWINRKIGLDKEEPLPQNIESCVRLLKDNYSDNDSAYLESVKHVLSTMQQDDAVKELNSIDTSKVIFNNDDNTYTDNTYSPIANYKELKDEDLESFCIENDEDEYKCGFKDHYGNIIIPAKFDSVFLYFQEGLSAACLNKKWGFIDKSGSIVIPLQFENVQYFSEGLASVEVNGKWGFIDKSGKFIFEPKSIM